jgi:hypothetical protein
MDKQNWQAGIHINSRGQEIPLQDIPIAYLQNIINKYSSTEDTTPLEDELATRENNP